MDESKGVCICLLIVRIVLVLKVNILLRAMKIRNLFSRFTQSDWLM